MNPLLKWLIGLRQLPQEAGEGAWHVEFQSLPQGFMAIDLRRASPLVRSRESGAL